jgi:hypothetical protein
MAVQNVTNYNIYLAQDLPWISNSGPNNENMTLVWEASGIERNATYEFGVLNSNFYLIFDLLPANELVTLKVGLSQYNTEQVYTVPPEVVIPAAIPGYSVLIMLAVSISAIVIVVFFMKRRNGVIIKHKRGEIA